VSLSNNPQDDLPSDAAERALALQELLVTCATGGAVDDAVFRKLRREFIDRSDTRDLVPEFVRSCRTIGAFWTWAKAEAGQYQQRRIIIRKAFCPLLDHLESGAGSPPDEAISETLESFDAEGVHRAWAKALDRRTSDPEGAITAARTLLETVCKRILDELGKTYSDSEDLPTLYRMAAEALTLAPDQHTEPVFKAILGSCQTLVNNLGTLRNKIGDAHGKGRPVRVSTRHAALAVNLAGAMSTFLVETHAERKKAAQQAGSEKPTFSPEYLAEIRSRIPVSVLVGRRIRLKKAGREWRGLSPFAPEATPSFYINDAKGFYHCFSTRKHGDIFTFLMETEGLNFAEAVERLAGEAGMRRPGRSLR
jgi:hypothetical protein